MGFFCDILFVIGELFAHGGVAQLGGRLNGIQEVSKRGNR